MKFKRNDVISFLGEELIESQCVNAQNVIYDSVVFDSREAVTDIIFVAMDGEKSVGIKYLSDAIEKGATCIIVNVGYKEEISSTIDEFADQCDFLFVRDTLYAFGLLGKLAREQFDRPVIGVAGSVGKTTTKNMLREIGGGQALAHASRGSYNNQTGVPLTLCAIGDQAKRAIVELGESHFGDLAYISEITRPTHLIITNVAQAHIEFLGDLAGVAKTMNEAVVLMDEDGVIVMPANTLHKDIVLKDAVARIIFVFQGETHEESDFRDSDVATISNVIPNKDLTHDFILNFKELKIKIHVPLIGRHFVMNAALAAIASLECGDDPNQINKNLQVVEPQGHRMRILKNDSLTIIDDCYNANPSSMMASMKTLKDMANESNARSVFVMGPMRELGVNSDLYHQQLGEYANKIGIDILICVDQATKSSSITGVHENSYFFASVEQACLGLPSIVSDGDFIGVKASRGPDPLEPAMVPIVQMLSDLKCGTDT